MTPFTPRFLYCLSIFSVAAACGAPIDQPTDAPTADTNDALFGAGPSTTLPSRFGNAVLCQQGVMYPANLTATPNRAFRWRPNICESLNNVRFTATAPLPSGVRLDPVSGELSGRVIQRSYSQYRSHTDPRSSLVLPGNNTLHLRVTWDRPPPNDGVRNIDVTYTYADPSAIRVRRGYGTTTHRASDGVVRVRPLLRGGQPPVRFEALDVLPGGLALSRSTGEIAGALDDPYSPDNDGVVRIRLSDAAGRSLLTTYYFRNAVDYDSQKTCFMFVHGHGPAGSHLDDRGRSHGYYQNLPACGDVLVPGQPCLCDPRLVQGLNDQNPNHCETAPNFPEDYTYSPPSYSKIRNYWRRNSRSAKPDANDRANIGILDRSKDMVAMVTNNGHHPYYLARWHSHASVRNGSNEVADQLVDAIRGEPDGGGNACDPAEVTNYVVIAHSYGGLIMANIVNRSGWVEHRIVSDAVSHVITVQSPHNGSHLADAACSNSDDLWANFTSGAVDLIGLANFCDAGTAALQTSRAGRQLRALRTTTWLIGGHAGLDLPPGALALGWDTSNGAFRDLAGRSLENDGLVPLYSAMACDRSFTKSATPNRMCGNGRKIASGFRNFDTAAEDHDVGRNGHRPRARRDKIVDGVWDQIDTPRGVNLSSAQAIACVFGGQSQDGVCPNRRGFAE